MAIRDILVAIDATSAGESRLRLALRLARDHRAFLAAAYCMSELSAPAVSALAVHGALPLLDRAEAVTVIYVGAQQASLEQHRPSLEWISSHLKRHRIPAQPEAILRGALSVSEVLLSRAADMSADLIVSGAYHHSQLREALIGGVSRDLMEQMAVPVLFSH